MWGNLTVFLRVMFLQKHLKINEKKLKKLIEKRHQLVHFGVSAECSYCELHALICLVRLVKESYQVDVI